MKGYDAPYASGYHSAPLYPTYENAPPPPPMAATQNNLISIKSEMESENGAESIDSSYTAHIKQSPLASDRSDSGSSLKIDDLSDTMAGVDVQHDKLKQTPDSMYTAIKAEQSSE